MECKVKWRKKRQRSRRELTGDWPDDKIRQLIYNVQIRPELWDIAITNYRIAKPKSWQKVALELGEEYDWRDCRLKWQNLRVTYKCNLNKIAKRQSEGIDEQPRILWRFFHSMQFISKNMEQNASDYISKQSNNMSDSTLNLDTELTTASCSTLASPQNFDFSQCSSNLIKQESPRTMETPTPTTTPTPPPPLEVASNSIKVTSKQMKNKNDEHACFGNFIASELRSLPPQDSFNLKRRLNRAILEYWDEMDAFSTAWSQAVPVTKTEVFDM